MVSLTGSAFRSFFTKIDVAFLFGTMVQCAKILAQCANPKQSKSKPAALTG